MVDRLTSPGFSTTGYLQALKTGELSPEQALEEAFPDPYFDLGDISVDELKVQVLPSGFRKLDEVGFLRRGFGDLIVVVADTSHGKSAFMMQLAEYVARTDIALVHSFEMSPRSLMTRVLAQRAGVSAKSIQKGLIPRSRLDAAYAEIRALKLRVSKSRQRDIQHIEHSVHELVRRGKSPSLIVVDYLQLIMTSGGGTRHLEIANISARLKDLAERARCPIIVGSQVNKSAEKRAMQRELKDGEARFDASISDIADSSAIAKDADMVLFITRPEQYNGSRPGEADIALVKNRDGETFKETWYWDGPKCQFREPKETL